MKNIFINVSLLLFIELNAQTINNEFEWEAFPILNYDYDAGVGYGGKGYIFNLFGVRESYDLILYNSTKGERWYRFVFSVPDIQRRHGKKYPIALDFIFEYDKWIKYYYYRTDFPSSKEIYTREPIEVTALISRGYTKDFVAELGFHFKSVSSYNFESDGVLKDIKPNSTEFLSLLFNFRVDTRNSIINPTSGYVLELAQEAAKNILTPPGQNFYKIGLTGNIYVNLFHSDLTWASRIILQSISQNSYHVMLPLGGNRTIRGLPQDRYLANSIILVNSEFRFPIWWRFGGVAAADIGDSETTPGWIFNPVAGLRFFMDNFVVRLDVGFGEDVTAVYLNFGHLF